MRDGGAAGSGYSFGIVIGLVVGTIIGAMILRMAVALANRMVGGEKSGKAVPTPSFGSAMAIAFVTTLVNVIAGFAVSSLIGAGAAVSGTNPALAQLGAQAASLPVGILIMAGMLTAALPTSFGRAVRVALYHFVIYVVIVGTIFGAIYYYMGPIEFPQERPAGSHRRI